VRALEVETRGGHHGCDLARALEAERGEAMAARSIECTRTGARADGRHRPGGPCPPRGQSTGTRVSLVWLAGRGALEVVR
jgi:hypothetical protein